MPTHTSIAAVHEAADELTSLPRERWQEETMSELTAYQGWVILELMGHRRLAGFIRTQEIAGASFLRLDVPNTTGDELVATQFYAPSAVYCITPTTEETARKVAALTQVAPVQHWELPALPQESNEGGPF